MRVNAVPSRSLEFLERRWSTGKKAERTNQWWGWW
jgi:hypothetical protein